MTRTDIQCAPTVGHFLSCQATAAQTQVEGSVDQLFVRSCTSGSGALSRRKLGGIFSALQLLLRFMERARETAVVPPGWPPQRPASAFLLLLPILGAVISEGGTRCCNRKSETSSAAAVSQATVTTPPGLSTSTVGPARLAQQCL